MSSILAMTSSYIPKHFIIATQPIFDSIVPRVSEIVSQDSCVLVLSSTFELTRDFNFVFDTKSGYDNLIILLQQLKQPRSIIIRGVYSWSDNKDVKQLLYSFHDLEYLEINNNYAKNHPSKRVRAFAPKFLDSDTEDDSDIAVKSYDEVFPIADEFITPEYIYDNIKHTEENLERLRDDFPTFQVNNSMEALRFVLDRYRFYGSREASLTDFLKRRQYIKWVLLGCPLDTRNIKKSNKLNKEYFQSYYTDYNWNFDEFTSEEIYRQFGDDIVNLLELKHPELIINSAHIFAAVPKFFYVTPICGIQQYLNILWYEMDVDEFLVDRVLEVFNVDELGTWQQNILKIIPDRKYSFNIFCEAMKQKYNFHCYHKHISYSDTVSLLYYNIYYCRKQHEAIQGLMETDNGMTDDEKERIVRHVTYE